MGAGGAGRNKEGEMAREESRLVLVLPAKISVQFGGQGDETVEDLGMFSEHHRVLKLHVSSPMENLMSGGLFRIQWCI